MLVNDPAKLDLDKLARESAEEAIAFLDAESIPSGKMRILRTTLVFGMTTQGIPNGDPYLTALKSAYEGAFDVSDVLRALDRIEKWCAYRNEVIHALMNKSVCSLQEELSDRCDEGMKLAREIDGYVKQLKQRNAIRTAMKAPKARR